MNRTSTLGSVARQIRSKNAGPFWVTIDIFLNSDADYETVAADGVITAERIAAMYGADEHLVKIFRLPNLRVVKISYPRLTPQGSMADRDVHAAQQYIPLLELELRPTS